MVRRVAKAPVRRERIKMAPPDEPVVGPMWKGTPVYQCPHCSVNSLREEVVREHLRLNHRVPESKEAEDSAPNTDGEAAQQQEEVIPSVSADGQKEETPTTEEGGRSATRRTRQNQG